MGDKVRMKDASKYKVQPSEIYNYLRSKGVPKEHAIGMMNNIRAESGFNAISSGDNGASMGLFQHNLSRRDALLKHVNGDLTDWKGQIDYTLSEKDTKKFLSNSFSNPKEASEWFTINWERPENKYEKAKERSNSIYRLYSNNLNSSAKPSKVVKNEMVDEEQWGWESAPTTKNNTSVQTEEQRQAQIAFDSTFEVTKPSNYDRIYNNSNTQQDFSYWEDEMYIPTDFEYTEVLEGNEISENKDKLLRDIEIEKEKQARLASSMERQTLLEKQEEQKKIEEFTDLVNSISGPVDNSKEDSGRNMQDYNQELGFDIQQVSNLFQSEIPSAKYGGELQKFSDGGGTKPLYEYKGRTYTKDKEGKWSVKVGEKFVPLSKGDIEKRYKTLNNYAKPVLEINDWDEYVDRSSKYADSLDLYQKQLAFNNDWLSNHNVKVDNNARKVDVDAYNTLKNSIGSEKAILNSYNRLSAKPSNSTGSTKGVVERRVLPEIGKTEAKPGQYVPNNVANSKSVFEYLGMDSDTNSKKRHKEHVKVAREGDISTFKNNSYTKDNVKYGNNNYVEKFYGTDYYTVEHPNIKPTSETPFFENTAYIEPKNFTKNLHAYIDKNYPELKNPSNKELQQKRNELFTRFRNSYSIFNNEGSTHGNGSNYKGELPDPESFSYDDYSLRNVNLISYKKPIQPVVYTGDAEKALNNFSKKPFKEPIRVKPTVDSLPMRSIQSFNKPLGLQGEKKPTIPFNSIYKPAQLSPRQQTVLTWNPETKRHDEEVRVQKDAFVNDGEGWEDMSQPVVYYNPETGEYRNRPFVFSPEGSEQTYNFKLGGELENNPLLKYFM